MTSDDIWAFVIVGILSFGIGIGFLIIIRVFAKARGYEEVYSALGVILQNLIAPANVPLFIGSIVLLVVVGFMTLMAVVED
ncbi:MAG: hypothetical protein J7L47_03115 [Candidatus Odinarchaeota archaeon]|nr:hypothetical protein [Candidatus Odinarchaeota archaeon]